MALWAALNWLLFTPGRLVVKEERQMADILKDASSIARNDQRTLHASGACPDSEPEGHEPSVCGTAVGASVAK